MPRPRRLRQTQFADARKHWPMVGSSSPRLGVRHFQLSADRPRAFPALRRHHPSSGGTSFLRRVRERGWHLAPGMATHRAISDMTALCESLTHDQLPHTVVAELLELVRATV